MTVIPIVIGAFGTVTKCLVQGLEDVEIKGRRETTQNYGIAEIGQNSEMSPRNLKPSANVDAKNSQKSNIRGAFNKFPDFFVQAFKIVVDSW